MLIYSEASQPLSDQLVLTVALTDDEFALIMNLLSERTAREMFVDFSDYKDESEALIAGALAALMFELDTP